MSVLPPDASSWSPADADPLARAQIACVGDELVDPDTGDKSREEVFVGRAKITRVTPQNSQAEILEDSGIDKGALVRLKDDVTDETED